MLDSNDISTIEIVVLILRQICVFVSLDGPFFVVLTYIGLVPGEEIFWIASAEGRLWTIDGLELVLRYGRLEKIFGEMQVNVVLLIVEDDLVIEDHLVTLLTILVSWHDLKGDSACYWLVGELQLLTCLIFFGALLRQLQELPTSLVLQLDIEPIVDVLPSLSYEIVLIVRNLINSPLIEDAQSLLILLVELLVILYLGCIAAHFRPQLVVVTCYVIIQLWIKLENHIPLIGH